MTWLSRVRNGIPFLPKRQVADNLWHKCKKCDAMVFTKEWEDNLFCCPRCDHHDRIGPKARFDQLFDGAKYKMIASPDVREDPLRFRDTKRYSDRLKAARTATEEKDALLNAEGLIGRRKVPSCPECAPRSPRTRPTSCSPPPAARGCRKAYCR